nr:copia protein [Tanacetum cinerariifolium]
MKPKLDVDLSGELVDQTDYRIKIKSLMYLKSSRPDIVQAVCYCACYQARPTEKHLQEDKRIFRYLKGTINMGLWYAKDSGFKLTAFSDVNHAGCLDTRKSTSGVIQFLGNKLVSWMSKKQDCTTMSSAEEEYMALSSSCAQVMWMRTYLKDYGFKYKKIPFYSDSQSAIAISCNPMQHSRTKHIYTRYHFIKEKVENGIIELYFVKTEYQLADMFTKALPEDRFQYLVKRIGDKNPICTLGDYSKPSHKGHMNIIELSLRKNVVPLRSDTIRLVQNGCSFLKPVDSLDLDDANRERTRLCLFQFSLCDQASNWLERLLAGSITIWEDLTTRFLAQYFQPGRTAKLRNDILMFQQQQQESSQKHGLVSKTYSKRPSSWHRSLASNSIFL